ncbi:MULTISPECIES: VPS10 domain-containing protein [unclassified Cellulophaga]|uniref:VPS10 domain-containing protein n=1 Tax=unclassified Cellulophaga TaxID=2634405 RepID=UPI0026E22894|nr:MULTISPECIES: glycosyl hydrolase [unclassified Cellulophaga]MDO6489802.1 glycosyl hydrolase [Cellulophaga sp. 2_MG-2023]MDO6495004.1 glycosyl hydrolase [Cellulophaga sp. 3_MG-2023]
MKKILSFCFLLSGALSWAQPAATPQNVVEGALKQKKQMQESSIVKNIAFTNIGPTVMSGRIVDVSVNPDKPTEFYAAYASGGLWYTNNNGTTFTPVMDSASTQNIGDIAVDWKTGVIWVGTGENNSSRSSYAGVGLLKSTDKGKTWQNMGLVDAHHIGRILINPKNSNEVVVGATGHLYSANKERGIYKTIDGGKTWKKTLFVNDVTGIIDVAMVPTNFSVQYAAAWEKDRKAWNFSGNGSNSAIYKSVDGGSSWTKITTKESGFPVGEGVGRIGLAVFDENTVYAVHDSQFRRPAVAKKKNASNDLVKDDFKTMSTKEFLALSDSKLNNFLKTNGFHEKHRAPNVKQMVRVGTVKPIDIAKYLEDANSMLFDTPVVGAEVFRSDDAGKTWKKTNTEHIDNLFYSYGYYFAQIRVHPKNKDEIYLAGVPLIKSNDGGKTFNNIDGANVHSDHHALWINPDLKGHLINGNDGGINISYDDGKSWIKNNSPAVGQFYAINVDDEKPYNVYGGLQDNGVWVGANNARESVRWHQTGHYPWKSLMGGDGMQVQVDSRNANIVYTGFQFGNYFRIDRENDSQKYIQPKHNLGESPYRFNWQTPILLSSHNQDILYLGGNKLHRSFNKGDNWETISSDLTNGGKKGNVAYGTLTTISESPFKFGVLYTGSDDGAIQLTKNGGATWEKISDNLNNDELWVSRVVASAHKQERVYVTLNGYRWDDYTPYVYLSNDYGKSWKNIGKNIPASPVNVIIEDPVNENLLFVGTDNGLYVTFNMGETWELFTNGMPAVAVHDLVIQPTAKDLLVGTHGRSIYKANIAKLQKMTPAMLSNKLHLFKPESIKFSGRWGNAPSTRFRPNTPGVDVNFYAAKSGSFKARILTMNNIEVSAVTVDGEKGFNVLSYDVAFSKTGKSNYLKKNKAQLTQAKDGKTYLPKGTYKIELSGNGGSASTSFEIQ